MASLMGMAGVLGGGDGGGMRAMGLIPALIARKKRPAAETSPAASTGAGPAAPSTAGTLLGDAMARRRSAGL